MVAITVLIRLANYRYYSEILKDHPRERQKWS